MKKIKEVFNRILFAPCRIGAQVDIIHNFFYLGIFMSIIATIATALMEWELFKDALLFVVILPILSCLLVGCMIRAIVEKSEKQMEVK